MAGGAAALAAACSSTVKTATAVKPAGSDIGAIEHFVFLMHENRSFDHYFGSYRGARGFDDHKGSDLGAFAPAWSTGPATANGRLLPFHLDTQTTNASCTYDLSHEWSAQHASWNGGKMDRFVATHVSDQFDGPEHGQLTMGYYTRDDLPFYYSLADAFTLCDGYHCSVLGPTHPNRLYSLSGTLDPAGTAGGPVIITNVGNPTKFSVSWETMPERLSAEGVSWKVYNPTGPTYRPESDQVMFWSDNMLLYFKQFSDPSTALHKQAFGSTFTEDFARDVASGNLPQVSWIVPPIGYDEHPPAPPALGEWFSHQVLQALVASPSVWAKTAFFIMYDENDGFFDHVSPPVPPAGTAGEYLTVDPLPTFAKGVAGPIGLGVRVPMLVVSPFSAGGYINSDTFDHTSQLRLLETRFGVEVPNLSDWRRSVTGDLTSALTAAVTTAVPKLPDTPQHPALIDAQCTPDQITLEHNAPMAAYPVPPNQTMPTQESGQAKRVAPRTGRSV